MCAVDINSAKWQADLDNKVQNLTIDECNMIYTTGCRNDILIIPRCHDSYDKPTYCWKTNITVILCWTGLIFMFNILGLILYKSSPKKLVKEIF